MSAQSDKMDVDEIEPTTENPSLLNLDDCTLMDIFQFLQYDDLVNLSKTCKRLKDVCKYVFFRKYSEIEVRAIVRMTPDNNVSSDRKSLQDIHDFSRMVGSNILRIEQQQQPNSPVEEYVILLLSYVPLREEQLHEEPLPLRYFRNLQKFKVPDVIISGNELKNCFIRNPDLQCEFDGCYGPAVVTLLKHFPKIISLRLEDKMDQRQRLNAECFDLITSFGHLEVLSLVKYIVDNCVLETVVLPLMLRKIKIYTPALSFNILSSIVQRLEFLEEIDLGRSRMFWYNGKSVTLGTINDPLFVSHIAHEFNRRKLNIFICGPFKKFHCFYQSDNLNIINRS